MLAHLLTQVEQLGPADLAVLHDLGPSVTLFLAGTDGVLRATLVP